MFSFQSQRRAMPKNVQTTVQLCSCRILARLFSKSFKLSFSNQEFPDVQAGFRKGRETRDQITNIGWITEKTREFEKDICFIDYTKAFDCVDHNKLENSERDRNTTPPYLSPKKSVCRSRGNS